MAIRSEAEIYKIIERLLKNSSAPLSSSALWENSDVRANARSAEKVSDYLGLMWRRGLLQRWDVPATATSRSRYAYSWLNEDEAPQKIERLHPVASTYRKSNVVVTEDGDRVILDFDKFTLIVQAKG